MAVSWRQIKASRLKRNFIWCYKYKMSWAHWRCILSYTLINKITRGSWRSLQTLETNRCRDSLIIIWAWSWEEKDAAIVRPWMDFSGVKCCCIFSSTKWKRNTGLTKQVCFGLEGYNGLQILLYWLEKYFDFLYCQILSSQMYWKAFCLRGQRPAD